MRLEHQDIYEDTFSEGFAGLQKVMSIKLFAIEKCQAKLDAWSNSGKKQEISYDLKVMTTDQIAKLSLEDIAKKFKTKEEANNLISNLLGSLALKPPANEKSEESVSVSA